MSGILKEAYQPIDLTETFSKAKKQSPWIWNNFARCNYKTLHSLRYRFLNIIYIWRFIAKQDVWWSVWAFLENLIVDSRYVGFPAPRLVLGLESSIPQGLWNRIWSAKSPELGLMLLVHVLKMLAFKQCPLFCFSLDSAMLTLGLKIYLWHNEWWV